MTFLKFFVYFASAMVVAIITGNMHCATIVILNFILLNVIDIKDTLDR